MAVSWEAAHAKAYRIEVSADGSTWRAVASVADGDGGLDVAVFPPTAAHYLRVVGVKRATSYGYSIWEVGAQST